jgi:hypothetical protein
MSVAALVRNWNRFLFEPKDPTPVSLFRILYGLLIIADLLLLHRSWLEFYGTHAWLSLTTMHKLEPGVRLNIFTLLPQNDIWIRALFWVFLGLAICLAAGLFTRTSSLLTFLCLTSIHQRNLYVLNAGDGFLRVAGFFLIFAPAGAALSLDRWLRMRRGVEGTEVPLKAPWAQRLIQFQMALLYLTASWWKSLGPAWVDGTAVYYVFHLDQLRRFPVPALFQSPAFVKIESWFTLAIEFSLGTLVWFKELRYPVLVTGAVFHLLIDYALNIPLFEWTMISAYVLFIEPSDLKRIGRWLAGQLRFERTRSV